MYDKLKESLRTAKIVDFDGYQYFIHPATDGIPEVQSGLLEEIVDGIVQSIDGDFDKVVTPEAMGIPIATALTLRTGKPFVIIRKRRYKLPGETVIEQQTGYSKGNLYVNGLNAGDRVVFVDDVVSTGGTLRAIIPTLKRKGVIVKEIVIVVEKGDGKAKLEAEIGQKIKSLVRVKVSGGKVVIGE
jgi:adenine phosphoribosyltransferase